MVVALYPLDGGRLLPPSLIGAVTSSNDGEFKMSTAFNSLRTAGWWSRLTGSHAHSLRYVLPGIGLVAVGIGGLTSLAVSPPTAATLGTVLFLGGVIESAGGFANLRRKAALLHVLVGVLALEAGFIFFWLPADAMIPLAVVITALLIAGGVARFYSWLKHRSETHAAAPTSGIVDLMLAVLVWVAWPASVFWILALAVGISLVFRGIHWINLEAVSRRRLDGVNGLVQAATSGDRSALSSSHA